MWEGTGLRWVFELYYPNMEITPRNFFLRIDTALRINENDRYATGYRSIGLVILGFGFGFAWCKVLESEDKQS